MVILMVARKAVKNKTRSKITAKKKSKTSKRTPNRRKPKKSLKSKNTKDKSKEKNKLEFSKKILNETRVIFASQLLCGFYCILKGLDTSFFIYSIPVSGGVYGAAICFYLNKAKIENIWKGKIGYLKLKINLKLHLSEDQWNEVENELSTLEETFNMKIDSAFSEAVQSDINTQNY